MTSDRYAIRSMFGIPANWRERSDADIMHWAHRLDSMSGDVAQQMQDEMWDELADRDHQREIQGMT